MSNCHLRAARQRVNRLIAQLDRDYPAPQKRTPEERTAAILADISKPLDNVGENSAESEFASMARDKGGVVFRSGWPDYLLELPGRTIGVEVKRSSDEIRPNQAKMFAALERAGLHTFIWNPRYRDRLIPWRKYLRRKHERKRVPSEPLPVPTQRPAFTSTPVPSRSSVERALRRNA